VTDERASDTTSRREEEDRLAQLVRGACLRVALDSYDRAGLSGLCPEGRWGLAIDAMRSLDLDAIVTSAFGLVKSINW